VNFQLPGDGAFCGEAHDVTAVISLGEFDPIAEGDPSGASTMITADVTATAFGTVSEPVDITVLWDVSRVSGGSSVSSDLTLPTERKLVFHLDGDTASHTQAISFAVVRDNDYEPRERFRVALDISSVTITPQDAQWVIGQSQVELVVLNDDAPPILENLDAPADAVVFFDFDTSPATGPPVFTTVSTRDIIPAPPQLDKFESSAVVATGATALRSGSGLPAVYAEADGNIVLSNSRGLMASTGTLPIPGLAGHQGAATFEFTVDPTQGYWRPSGIEFFVLGSDSVGPAQEWELTWSLDNFSNPIMTSNDASASTAEATDYPGWTKHAADFGLLELPEGETFLCGGGAITFRLTHASADASSWTVDNMALQGEHFVANCLADDPDTVAAELSMFLDQMDHRLPGAFEIDGPGISIVTLASDPADSDPDPNDMVNISIAGASPVQTTLRFLQNGTFPPSNELVRVNIRSDQGVNAIDFSAVPLFRGVVDIGGSVGGGVQLGGLMDGSRFMVDNASGVPVDIMSAGPFGNLVDVAVTGDIGSLDIAQSWVGGSLTANNVAHVAIDGDLGANVALQFGLGCIEVSGGDLNSTSFATGLAAGAGNGPAECISSTAVDGVGGSIGGNFTIDGNLGSMSGHGGTITATIAAFDVDAIVATLDETSNTGGDISGQIAIGSFQGVTSVGGVITATIMTQNAAQPSGVVAALMINGTGGGINSPDSFHFAGDVDAIIGRDINPRVGGDGTVGLIRALADSDGTAPSLAGNFTARRFGEIRVDRGGNATFSLTTTEESWSLNQDTAFDSWMLPARGRERLVTWTD